MNSTKRLYNTRHKVFENCMKIILLLTSMSISHLALGNSQSLCGVIYNASGTSKIEKITVKANPNYSLPRDPFSLQMFDINDQYFLGKIESHSTILWQKLLSESNFLRIKKLQSENISLCLDSFESINVRSSASLFLLVQKALKFRVWQNGQKLFSSQRP